MQPQRRFSVYYRKEPTFFSDPTLTVHSLSDTHTKVRDLAAQSLEDVFRIQQGEVWSPNGEARPLIERLGLFHTSMSVGDVILDQRTMRYYQVANSGFTLLKES